MKLKKEFINLRVVAFIHDIVMVAAAWLCAYAVRQNLMLIPQDILRQSVSWLPAILIIQASFFIFFGLYRGVWRFASVPDLIRITKSVLFGVSILFVYAHFTVNTPVIPRSIPLLYTVFLILFLSFGRLSVRLYKERKQHTNAAEMKRVLIVGAGTEAEKLIREIISNNTLNYKPVVIVDNDPSKMNREIHGIRIAGNFKAIEKIVHRYEINTVFIAVTKASSIEMELILKQCHAAQIPFRIIPSLSEQIKQSHLLSTLRDVNLEDLLGRETYQVDMSAFEKAIKNKKVLVTGGGGSIGSELCRQIAMLNPAELLVIDQSEANLYHLDLMLRENFSGLALKIALIDIIQLDMLSHFFETHKPTIVFHAAAYKHVPMLENQIVIAARNNVIGSKNVVDLAIKYCAELFVQVSTDKAVNPSNIMGLTKRAAEIYCQNLNPGKTKIITVRFGNVLGSVGSVVPLFKKQLERGGPLTVTHPDITRYFMTIPEACRLILQAMVMGRGGEIFVLDMGKPIKIKDIAERMIYLAGKTDDDIKIIYTGLRPGEKLWEELFYNQETIIKTKHQKIFLAENTGCDVAFKVLFTDIMLACKNQNATIIFEKLFQLVPEYSNSEKQVVEMVSQSECIVA
ncbi:MAG: nucleoside-diphosphate sugar epimerase/dehydratase [Coxiellaceae bacterium]|nr:nucleoside-diphosphate sugar epimerase/dehydratase [Coxiellaceae bacterium]